MSQKSKTEQNYYKITNAKNLKKYLPQMDGLILSGDELFGRSPTKVEPGIICQSLAAVSEIHPHNRIEECQKEDLDKLPPSAPESIIPERGWMVKDIPNDVFDWLDPIASWQEPKVEIECILPGLMRTAVGSLVSPGGTGKSMLTLQTCVDLALGNKSCLNPKSKAHKVAYISVEDQSDMVRNRLHDTLKQFEFTERNQQLVRDNLRAVGTNNLIVGTKGEVYPERVIEKFGGYKPDLLVLDTVSRLHRFDENSASDMAMLLGAFEDIGRELDCAVLILHHSSKGAMFARSQGHDVGSAASRGSSVLVDNARSVWSLNTMSKGEADKLDVKADERRDYVQLTQEKCNIDRWMDAQWFKRSDNGLLEEFSFSVALEEERDTPQTKTTKQSPKKKLGGLFDV